MLFFVLNICRNPNWWPRRTALEKSLIIISILSLIGIIVLVLSLSGVVVKKRECESKFSSIQVIDVIPPKEHLHLCLFFFNTKISILFLFSL